MNETEFEVAPRFVFLGDSIVSDWRNPLATTSRAVLRALGAMGFEAVYLEPRRNSATVGLLHQRGAQVLQAFNQLWSDVQYRTVDLPSRRETEVWIGQFAATSGVVVGLQGISEAVERGLGEFVSDDIEILIERPELDDDWSRTLIQRIGHPTESIGFRPAVLPENWPGERSGTLLVACDDADLAKRVAERVPAARRIVCGSAELPDWEFIPEIELPPLYGGAERVLVIDAPDRPTAPARIWLPRANGADAWGIVETTQEIDTKIVADVQDLANIWEKPQPELPKRLDATWVARGLVDLFRYRSIIEP